MRLTSSLAVLGGVQREESGAEAGRESRRGLGDAALGTCQLGGEARQEVVLRLLGVRIDTGGSTPNASAERKITFLAAGAFDTGFTMFSMWKIG